MTEIVLTFFLDWYYICNQLISDTLNCFYCYVSDYDCFHSIGSTQKFITFTIIIVCFLVKLLQYIFFWWFFVYSTFLQSNTFSCSIKFGSSYFLSCCAAYLFLPFFSLGALLCFSPKVRRFILLSCSEYVVQPAQLSFFDNSYFSHTSSVIFISTFVFTNNINLSMFYCIPYSWRHLFNYGAFLIYGCSSMVFSPQYQYFISFPVIIILLVCPNFISCYFVLLQCFFCVRYQNHIIWNISSRIFTRSIFHITSSIILSFSLSSFIALSFRNMENSCGFRTVFRVNSVYSSLGVLTIVLF